MAGGPTDQPTSRVAAAEVRTSKPKRSRSAIPPRSGAGALTRRTDIGSLRGVLTLALPGGLQQAPVTESLPPYRLPQSGLVNAMEAPPPSTSRKRGLVDAVFQKLAGDRFGSVPSHTLMRLLQVRRSSSARPSSAVECRVHSGLLRRNALR
jgi:hypothetical protein